MVSLNQNRARDYSGFIYRNDNLRLNSGAVAKKVNPPNLKYKGRGWKPYPIAKIQNEIERPSAKYSLAILRPLDELVAEAARLMDYSKDTYCFNFFIGMPPTSLYIGRMRKRSRREVRQIVIDKVAEKYQEILNAREQFRKNFFEKGGSMKTVENILVHYVACALWTDNERLQEEANHDFDFYISDCSEKFLAKSRNDIEKALSLSSSLLCEYRECVPNWEEQFGHDFWLTRNGHGAGFWDRGLGELGEKLSNISKTFSEVNLWYNPESKKVAV